MSDAVTYAVEIGVGVASLALAPAAWRGARTRWVGVVLLAAGLVAVVHGVVALARWGSA